MTRQPHILALSPASFSTCKKNPQVSRDLQWRFPTQRLYQTMCCVLTWSIDSSFMTPLLPKNPKPAPLEGNELVRTSNFVFGRRESPGLPRIKSHHVGISQRSSTIVQLSTLPLPHPKHPLQSATCLGYLSAKVTDVECKWSGHQSPKVQRATHDNFPTFASVCTSWVSVGSRARDHNRYVLLKQRHDPQRCYGGLASSTTPSQG